MYMSKNMSNQEIAQLLRQVAAAYEARNLNYFRIRAYQNAATSIENRVTPLKAIWEKRKP
jgi:DNA polymerase/3'-5' exonuclease PolX